MIRQSFSIAAASFLVAFAAQAQPIFNSVDTLAIIDGGAPIVEASFNAPADPPPFNNPSGQNFEATANNIAGITVRFTNGRQGPTDTFNATLTLFSDSGFGGSVLATETLTVGPFNVVDGPGNTIEATQDVMFLFDDTISTAIGDSLSFAVETDTAARFIRSSDDVYSDGNLLTSDGSVFGTFGVDMGFSVQSEVPEPSTYAAIFGALALGIAVVRRRLKRNKA